MAVTPDGSKVYVTNFGDNGIGTTVSVINTSNDTVLSPPITVGTGPIGVAFTPDGSKGYVANFSSSTVSVINTSTSTATPAIGVFNGPAAFGQFILPRAFAGKPGTSNCVGQTTADLAKRFVDLTAATQALGFSSVSSLQAAIRQFCRT